MLHVTTKYVCFQVFAALFPLPLPLYNNLKVTYSTVIRNRQKLDITQMFIN